MNLLGKPCPLIILLRLLGDDEEQDRMQVLCVGFLVGLIVDL